MFGSINSPCLAIQLLRVANSLVQISIGSIYALIQRNGIAYRGHLIGGFPALLCSWKSKWMHIKPAEMAIKAKTIKITVRNYRFSILCVQRESFSINAARARNMRK